MAGNTAVAARDGGEHRRRRELDLPRLIAHGQEIHPLTARGMICTGETYKSVVKLTFFKGASLEDPSGLFNSSLEGNTRRAIDVHEGEEIDEDAFVSLIRAAVSLNES
jgi:hypothetical protein